MGVAIFFRNRQETNYFRDCIFKIIDCDKIDGIIWSYPYYYEKKPYMDKNNMKKSGYYSILNDVDLTGILITYNILGHNAPILFDLFIDTIFWYDKIVLRK